MTNQPLVSIVMPAYNAARYIEIAVGSVTSQTYSNWELLIVNDASKDNTVDVVERLKAGDPRIKFFSNAANKGVAGTRNVAVENAAGKYIAFLDSDDLWLPQKLQKQVDFMESNDVHVCYSRYQRIDEEGNALGIVSPPSHIDYPQLLKSNFIGNLTGVYNAAVLGKQYFPKCGHEDYVAWLGVLKKAGHASSVDEVLAHYRVYGNSTSGNKLRAMSWQWKIYREQLSLSFFKSLSLMASYFYFALLKRV